MTSTVQHQVMAELEKARHVLVNPFKVKGLDWDMLNSDLDIINLLETTLEKLQRAPLEKGKEPGR